MSTFRALRNSYNYRLWAAGALVSNIGTWMQRTAQDWIVLTQLTDHQATAVGITMALQFGPQALLMPLTGYAADHFERRKLLMLTQGCMGLLALCLGVLALGGWLALWQVYLLAGLQGCVAAFDAPARQTFVGEMVGDADLANAVALNSASFNSGRLLGPAAAGWVIAGVGTGWALLVNALSFAAVLLALARLRSAELHGGRAPRGRKGLADGLRYVAARPALKTVLLMLFLVGTFGLNFPIYISTMAVGVFHASADEFGLLTSAMAIGSVSGALLAARRAEARLPRLVLAALVFGVGCGLAAVAPRYGVFAVLLVLCGVCAQTFTTGCNALIQLGTEAGMRGRVMALYLCVALGGTPLGAPLVGWVVDHGGPRWGMAVGALAGLLGAAVGALYLLRLRRPVR
ncbi:MFS transporter [Pseudomonas sp. NPDC007930]|uniref:MFS transporter n=1 Tax=Pseudomonas sp. NPDC007930 TaxID=3364417 RepID=UPI0036ED68F1